MQVGDPKFRFPASENAWPLSFFSLVHRTTSHGGVGVSISLGSRRSWLVAVDTCRLWVERKGDEGRGERRLDEEIRDWNLKSKGLKEGVGLFMPGREQTERRTLLLGDEAMDPCVDG